MHDTSTENTSASPTLMDYALGMAALGYPIYPTRLTRRDDGKKDPIAPVGWRTGVSTDPDQIRAWFATGTRYNAYMIDCEAAGIVVLDLDVKDQVNARTGEVIRRDGVSTWAALGGQHAAMNVVTESGGRHLYFRATPEWSRSLSSDRAGLGVDVQGVGKCVFGPGSFVEPDGRRYLIAGKAVAVAALTPVPHDVIERGVAARAEVLETQRRARDAAHPTTAGGGTAADQAADQAAARVDRAWGDLAASIDGGFNDALNSLCYEVGRWFATLGRDADEARAYIVDAMAAHPIIDPADAADLKTIHSTGVDNGLENPWEAAEPRFDVDELLGQPSDPTQTAPDSPADVVDTWAPVDLEAILSGEYVPLAASVLTRVDGVGMLYPGKVNAIIGESESGKSWVAQTACAQVLARGGSATYVDYESDAADVVGRLLLLGVPADTIRQRFRYIRPDQAATTSPGAFRALLASSQDLVVIDGVTDALGTEGLSLLDNDEISTWYRRVLRPLARHTGAAVLTVDHVTKSGDGRGRFAIGGQHKLSGIDGAALLAEVEEPFGRGMRGVGVIRIAKDRPGGLRPHGGEYRQADRTQELARFVLDATGTGVVAEMLAVSTEPVKPAEDERVTVELPWDIVAPPEVGAALSRPFEIPGGGGSAVPDLARWMLTLAPPGDGAGRSRAEAVAAFKTYGVHSRNTLERAWDRLLEAGAIEAVAGQGRTGRSQWVGPVHHRPPSWG